MRISVDLPPAVRKRAEAISAARGQSLSATIAELTVRGLSQLDEPVTIAIDPRSGFPVMSFGRPITSDDVTAALDDE
ncbi:MAG: hypothetical protein ABI382_12110 [Nakamurella sp.]